MPFKLPSRFQTRYDLPVLVAWFFVFALAAKGGRDMIATSTAPVAVPSVKPHFPLKPKEAARIVTESKLLGEIEPGMESISRLQVGGLMTGPQGFALVSENSGPMNPFIVGEEVVPGVRLEKIAASHIELSNGLHIELQPDLVKTDIPVNPLPVAKDAEQYPINRP